MLILWNEYDLRYDNVVSHFLTNLPKNNVTLEIAILSIKNSWLTLNQFDPQEPKIKWKQARLPTSYIVWSLDLEQVTQDN